MKTKPTKGRRPGRPKKLEGRVQLTAFRLPEALLDQLRQAQRALGKASIADLVREALDDYLAKHRRAIEDVTRARRRHGLD